ncbi:MAG TPA: 50S ribosomal protein L4 [Nitrospiria bacterium]|nr:50S ribosomal protein L4 [Nitrospiria bacterium]
MPEIEVKNSEGKGIGMMGLSDRLFATGINKPLVHEVLVMQMASMRQGTASTKTKGLVSGGGKKPWKQKGTGRARAGSTRSPLWKGGGTTFGPLPRDYSYNIPKKKHRAAIASALTAKLSDGEFVVVDDISLPEAKTKLLCERLEKLGLKEKTLIILDGVNEKIERAAGNIQNVKVIQINRLNLYDILYHKYLLINKKDVEKLAGTWS